MISKSQMREIRNKSTQKQPEILLFFSHFFLFSSHLGALFFISRNSFFFSRSHVLYFSHFVLYFSQPCSFLLVFCSFLLAFRSNNTMRINGLWRFKTIKRDLKRRKQQQNSLLLLFFDIYTVIFFLFCPYLSAPRQLSSLQSKRSFLLAIRFDRLSQTE